MVRASKDHHLEPPGIHIQAPQGDKSLNSNKTSPEYIFSSNPGIEMEGKLSIMVSSTKEPRFQPLPIGTRCLQIWASTTGVFPFAGIWSGRPTFRWISVGNGFCLFSFVLVFLKFWQLFRGESKCGPGIVCVSSNFLRGGSESESALDPRYMLLRESNFLRASSGSQLAQGQQRSSLWEKPPCRHYFLSSKSAAKEFEFAHCLYMEKPPCWPFPLAMKQAPKMFELTLFI